MADNFLGNIASALAVTGSNRRLQEELLQQQAAPQQPAAAPVEPAPAPTAPPQPEQPPTPPAPVQIEDQAFTGRGNLKQQSLAGTNRAMDLVTEQGAVASEGADKRAVLEGQKAAEQRENLDVAKGQVDTNRAQKSELEQRLFQQIDDISERSKHPPKDTMAMVMGIVGAIMAAKGNQGGAVAAQMMGHAMGSKTQAWQNGIEADKENLNQMFKMHKLQDDDSDSELNHATKLNALAAGQFDSALRQVAAETDSKEAKRAAEQARLALRQQAVGAQMKMNAAAGNAKQQNDLYRLIASQPTPELQSQVAAQYGKAGQAVLQDVQKSMAGTIKNAGDALDVAAKPAKAAAEVSKLEAEAAKARGEGGGAGDAVGGRVAGGYQIADEQVWKSVPAPVRTAFVKGQGALPGLVQKLTRLRDMVREHGTETLPGQTKSEMQALHAAALGDIKEMAELGALDNGVIALVDRQLGDPTAWNFGFGNAMENADGRIDTTLDTIVQGAAQKARTYGLESSLTPAKQAPAQAPATTEPVVTMYRRDGKPVQVPAGKVALVKSQGWTEAAPAQQPSAPAALVSAQPNVQQMSDAEYEEYVRNNR